MDGLWVYQTNDFSGMSGITGFSKFSGKDTKLESSEQRQNLILIQATSLIESRRVTYRL